MPLSSYALMTLDELKEEIPVDGDGEDAMLEAIANQGTKLAEQVLQREILSRGEITEYHTFPTATSKLYLMDYPAITITSVHEDPDTSFSGSKYGSAYLLVENTDYIVSKPSGLLTRISGACEHYWAAGLRAVKVVGTFGYASLETVPDEIRGYAKWIAKYIYKDGSRGFGVASQSDAIGNITRFGLNRHMREMGEALSAHMKRDRWTSGERAA